MNLFDLGGKLLRIGRSITPLSVLASSTKDSNMPCNATATAMAQRAAALATAKIIQSADEKPTKGSSFLTDQTVTSSQVSQDASFDDEDTKKKKDELHKKLLEESLQQQESMSIKGQNARHLVMQKLMRNQVSKVVVLRNMVGHEDVDESLQEEIQDECSKYGRVEKVIIYKEKQTDNDDDNFGDVIVKIFVEFSTPAGECLKLFKYYLSKKI